MNDESAQRRTVGILLFDDVEVLDFAGPFEVFSVTGQREGPGHFEVFTVCEDPEPVLTRNGLSVNPHFTFRDHPPLDLLVVPGGFGTRRELHNPAVLSWIRAVSRESELTLSVCTGALLLGAAGLLEGLEATTHHGAYALLEEVSPGVRVTPGRRFVDNGKVVLAAGVSAGIDMALHVVERLHGSEVAEESAAYMEYDWRRDS